MQYIIEGKEKREKTHLKPPQNDILHPTKCEQEKQIKKDED